MPIRIRSLRTVATATALAMPCCWLLGQAQAKDTASVFA